MQRWYWIELIGFDCEADDYGVGAFLSRNVTTTGVSLLLAHIDFIFCEDELLPPTACSYFGHEYNRERRRQDWTKTQLRGLISELHKHGVKVFFSCFDMTRTVTDPTMLCYGRNGEPHRMMYVLKRDVGEIFVQRIRSVLDEYGFDGLQLADGLSSNRLSVENGDFSPELCLASGISIPDGLMNSDVGSYAARREWILQNARYEWIEFLAKRWSDFYALLFDTVKKPIIFNSAWTRDPFEALYRYGLDYSSCQVDRAMAIMVEENSASRAIMATEDEGGVEHTLGYRDGFAYEYALMQQGIRLYTDGLAQISLMPISDTQEQWDALRHCPTELARSVVKRYNNFVYRSGGFEVCCDAPWYCLSDGIPAEDWKWLAKQEGYRIPRPDFIDGFVAVYNKSALRRDVKQFCEKRGYYGFALLCELASGGLNLSASVGLEDACGFKLARGLVVTDLNAYTNGEKQMLAASGLPIIAIGDDVELPAAKKSEYKGKYLSVAAYGDLPEIDWSMLAELEAPVMPAGTKHGEIWTEPLSYRRVAPEFFRAVARLLNEGLGLDRCDDPRIKLNSYLSGGEKYILISSDHHTYAIPGIVSSFEHSDVQALMKECGYKVKCRDGKLIVRIPPRSVEILRLVSQSED